MSCPCGSNQDFSGCCAPYLEGKAKPDTAEKLMRSRYCAFVENKVEYIVETTHSSTRDELDMENIQAWASESTWKELKILGTKDGGADDERGVVEFMARYEFNGAPQEHHEVSDFKKEDGTWYFVDGDMQPVTLRRAGPKVGRNDPCSCGSGKKFKKCCG